MEPWDADVELRRHIRTCACTCDHMGYGNYMDYQVSPLGTTTVGACRNGGTFGALPDVAERCGGHWVLDSASASSEDKPTAAIGGGERSRRGAWRAAAALLVLAGALAAALGLPMAFNRSGGRATPEQRLATVRRLLRDAPLVDGHNDLAWNVRKFLHNRIGDLDLEAGLASIEPWARSKWSHTDIPRLRLGLVGAQFWSAYVPCGAQHRDAVQLALEQMDVIKRLVEMHPEHLSLATDAAELVAAHRAGRIASLIGVEGGHALGESLAVLRAFYRLGARYLTVTHACDTSWARSASGIGRVGSGDGGLTDFGRRVVREMNRLGMLVDLSHAGDGTARDALNATRAPVVFSHSSAYALCNATRNVPDELLRLVAANGGVVMVNFYAKLVSCEDRADLSHVVAHINHVRRVAGPDHVGLGAGYDGIDAAPAGLEDVSRYPHLLAELLKDPTWSEGDLSKLAGLNVLRVLREVERVRDEWRRAAVPPGEPPAPVAPPERRQCSYDDA